MRRALKNPMITMLFLYMSTVTTIDQFQRAEAQARSYSDAEKQEIREPIRSLHYREPIYDSNVTSDRSTLLATTPYGHAFSMVGTCTGDHHVVMTPTRRQRQHNASTIAGLAKAAQDSIQSLCGVRPDSIEVYLQRSNRADAFRAGELYYGVGREGIFTASSGWRKLQADGVAYIGYPEFRALATPELSSQYDYLLLSGYNEPAMLSLLISGESDYIRSSRFNWGVYFYKFENFYAFTCPEKVQNIREIRINITDVEDRGIAGISTSHYGTAVHTVSSDSYPYVSPFAAESLGFHYRGIQDDFEKFISNRGCDDPTLTRIRETLFSVAEGN